MGKISIRKAKDAKTGLVKFIKRCKLESKILLHLIAEIGSYVGDSTEIFSNHFRKVYAIDPWKNGYDDSDGSSFTVPMETIETQFDGLVKIHPNIIKMKITSSLGSLEFLDESLDLVYIDAVHQYKDVMEDMILWYPKVREGGIIAGHDFQDSFPGCKKAILEMVGTPPILGKDTSWGFVKGSHPCKLEEFFKRISSLAVTEE